VWDLGDVVPLGLTIRDSVGALANGGTVKITITAPDGSVAVNAVTVTPTTTGTYGYDFTPTLPGRHQARWVSTGANAGAWAEAFVVAPADDLAFVSLWDAKARLGIEQTDTTHDEELRPFIATMCAVVEGIVGPVSRRSVTETHDGTAMILLRSWPVVSVTQVAENGTVLTSDAYAVTDTGLLRRKRSAYKAGQWTEGDDNITVTYVAGRTQVPVEAHEAALELLRLHYRPQVAGALHPFAEAESYGQGQSVLGYLVPYKVMDQLRALGRADTGVA